jgi:hypothetical protein
MMHRLLWMAPPQWRLSGRYEAAKDPSGGGVSAFAAPDLVSFCSTCLFTAMPPPSNNLAFAKVPEARASKASTNANASASRLEGVWCTAAESTRTMVESKDLFRCDGNWSCADFEQRIFLDKVVRLYWSRTRRFCSCKPFIFVRTLTTPPKQRLLELFRA